MLAKVFALGMFFLLVVALPALPQSYAVQQDYQENISNAVGYLKSHYRSDVGLVYESEDKGRHWIGREELPNFRWGYDQTFWLYSDNLFTYNAIAPYDAELANRIRATIDSYNLPPSGKFEALFGTSTGPDRSAHDRLINSSASFAILYRIHDGGFADPRYVFADVLAYDALSAYYKGLTGIAVSKLRQAIGMFNGTCMVDAGISDLNLPLLSSGGETDQGYCANMKIAIVAYAVKVVGTEIVLDQGTASATNKYYSEMEPFLWKQQIENGGISSLSRNGKPLGSANTETTSLALLLHNEILIQKLHQKGLDAIVVAGESSSSLESSIRSLTDRWHVDQPNNLDTFTALVAILVIGVTAVSIAALFYLLKKLLLKRAKMG